VEEPAAEQEPAAEEEPAAIEEAAADEVEAIRAGSRLSIALQSGSEEGLSEEDKDMIIKVFNYFDKDKSGALAASELGDLMRSIGKF
jgi:hypothetical protein